MKIEDLIREFTYNGVKLPDPNPSFTLVQVRDFYSNVYPEIISADIEGPTNTANRAVYAFRRAVGTKGRAPVSMRQLLADLVALGNAGKLNARDLGQVKALQQLASSGGDLSASEVQQLVDLQRRYLPAADK